MHLSRILDQIKRHPSPTEAIDKLGKALEKHEGSLLEKGFQILKSELCANALRDEKNALQTSAITQQQTQNIVNQIRPCPVPAYLTCNPYGCNGGFTGYGYPYGYNEGGCCA